MQRKRLDAAPRWSQINPYVAVVLVSLFATPSAGAAEREVIQIAWSGFGQQVSARRLEGRTVRIKTAGGNEIQTKLLAVTDGSLIVRANRATSQWTSGKKEASIPRDQIHSVRFLRHLGHRGLFTGLLSLGAAVGIGTALAASQDAFQITEGPVVIAAPLSIAAGAVGLGVAGYYIGRATSRQGPEFVINQ